MQRKRFADNFTKCRDKILSDKRIKTGNVELEVGAKVWELSMDAWNTAIELELNGSLSEQTQAHIFHFSCDLALSVFTVMRTDDRDDTSDLHHSLWRRLVKVRNQKPMWN